MTARTAVPVLFLALVVPALAQQKSAVDYPTGFRKWAHVKSMAIVSDKHPLYAAFGGMHHVYVNPTGLDALVKGKDFPDGSVLVFDLLEAKEDNGAWVEGDRKFVAIMQKDRARWKTTGGWGFEAFKDDSRTERTVTDATGQCFGCHQSQTKNDFVFSAYRP